MLFVWRIADCRFLLRKLEERITPAPEGSAESEVLSASLRDISSPLAGATPTRPVAAP